jgi:hypothetical protein
VPWNSGDRCAELDEVAVFVADVGDGLSPGLLGGLAELCRAGGDGPGIEPVDVGGDQGDFDGLRRLAGGSGDKFLAQVRGGHLQAGKRQAGRAGFELAVGFSGVVVEKAPLEAEGGFIEIEAGGDVFHAEDYVAEGWSHWGSGLALGSTGAQR